MWHVIDRGRGSADRDSGERVDDLRIRKPTEVAIADNKLADAVLHAQGYEGRIAGPRGWLLKR